MFPITRVNPTTAALCSSTRLFSIPHPSKGGLSDETTQGLASIVLLVSAGVSESGGYIAERKRFKFPQPQKKRCQTTKATAELILRALRSAWDIRGGGGGGQGKHPSTPAKKPGLRPQYQLTNEQLGKLVRYSQHSKAVSARGKSLPRPREKSDSDVSRRSHSRATVGLCNARSP